MWVMHAAFAFFSAPAGGMYNQQFPPFPASAGPCPDGNARVDRKPKGRYWKTKICFKWQAGTCPKGAECQFAHGEHELRPVEYPQPEEQQGPDDAQAAAPRVWLPPGADSAPQQRDFASDFDPNFIVPKRLANKSSQLVCLRGRTPPPPGCRQHSMQNWFRCVVQNGVTD